MFFPASSLQPPASSRGFTLIELIVVMGIIGLILASSVPALSGYARQIRLKTATREVIGLLSLARSQAIGSRTTKTVLIDPERREVVIEESSAQEEPRRARLPAAIAITVETQGQSSPPEGTSRLTFQPSGALAGRSTSLILSNGSRTQTIRISATTGSISVN